MKAAEPALLFVGKHCDGNIHRVEIAAQVDAGLPVEELILVSEIRQTIRIDVCRQSAQCDRFGCIRIAGVVNDAILPNGDDVALDE